MNYTLDGLQIETLDKDSVIARLASVVADYAFERNELKDLIEGETSLASNSVFSTLENFNDSIRRLFNRLEEVVGERVARIVLARLAAKNKLEERILMTIITSESESIEG